MWRIERTRKMRKIPKLRESNQNPTESRKIYFKVSPCNRDLNSIMETS